MEFDEDDEFDEEESSTKKPKKSSFTKGLLLIGYRVALGLGEVYAGPRMTGLRNNAMSLPGIDEILDECNTELHEMIGADDMDCWTKLLLCTAVAAGVTYTKNTTVGIDAPTPAMTGIAPASIKTLNTVSVLESHVEKVLELPDGSDL